jgi:hypothetical protein
MVAALVAAANQDYPLAGAVLRSGARPAPAGPVPQALTPVGRVATTTPPFAWVWMGLPAAFDLVILDEQLDEVHRVRAPAGSSCGAVDAIAVRLAGGEQLHWFVEATAAGHRVRSAPTAFWFCRD